tara:strand:+ start:1674 stop:3749 length:2076 start_codon:yes stop_codon:yes gene_type:complete
MSDNYWANVARASLGQGLALGWGDELEARIRAMSGDETYQEELAMINADYSKFSEDNEGVALGAEIAGGFIPTLAAIASTPFTGGASAPLAAANAARTAAALSRLRVYPSINPIALKGAIPKSALGRGVATGAISGGVAGSGTAEQGERFSGGVTGSVIGGGLGTAVPFATRLVAPLGKKLKDSFIGVSPEEADEQAMRRLYEAATRGDNNIDDIMPQINADIEMGVPTSLSNASYPLSTISDTVNAASRGDSSEVITDALYGRQADIGNRVERVFEDNIGDTKQLYEFERQITERLRGNANELYGDAFAAFEVIDDPRILNVLKTPAFQNALKKAKELNELKRSRAELDGVEDLSEFDFPELIDGGLPSLRDLDKIKRSLNQVARAEFKKPDGDTSMGAEVNNITKSFVKVLDEITEGADGISPYQRARKVYQGDAEVLDALDEGVSKYQKTPPEKIRELISEYSDAEAEVYRIGAARSIMDKVNKGQDGVNAARKTIGSQTDRRRLRALFPDGEEGDASYNLIAATLQRESQVYQMNARVLGGSPTASRQARVKEIDGIDIGEGVNDVAVSMLNPMQSLYAIAMRAISKAQMPKEIQERMAKMLVDEDSEKVAAAVKALEQYGEIAIPRAKQLTLREGLGTVGVVNTAVTGQENKTSYVQSQEEKDVEAAADLEAKNARDHLARRSPIL